MLNLNYRAVKRWTPQVLRPWLDRMEQSPSGLRQARGVFWSGLGAVMSRALALVASIITAQILGKAVFGEFGMIQSTLNMFATFATVGVGFTATKYVAELRYNNPERAGRIIAMSNLVALMSGSGVALVLIATAPWLAASLLAAPHLSLALSLSAVALLFTVISEAQIGTLSGFEAFKRRTTIQLAAGIGGFGIAVTGVYFFGLIGAVAGMVASQGLLVFLNHRAIRIEAIAAKVSIRWKEWKKEIQVLVSFSLPTLMGGAVYVPAMWVANTILVNERNGYSEMGVFSAADRWRAAILFLPILLGGVALPMLSSLQGSASANEYKKVLRTNIELSVLASFFVAMPVAALSSWIMASYGAGFLDGRWVLVILCASAVANSAFWIIGISLVSCGRMWTMFSLNLGWGMLLISSEWLWRRQGAMGLAFAYLLAESIRLAISLVYLKSLHPKSDPSYVLNEPVASE